MTMIRQATVNDIEAIAASYEALLSYEQTHGSHSNWVQGLYPTVKVPEKNVPLGTMIVFEENGEICASMVLNHEQASEYADVDWLYPGEGEGVLVVHTLCIPPAKAGHGYGSKMVRYAKERALAEGCSVVRIDTYAYNEPAKALYQKHGFRIAGYADSLLEGVIPEKMVYLEWKVADET